VLRPGRAHRLRIALVLAGFEAGMPLVGLLAGRALGRTIGEGAGTVAAAVLAALGLWLLLEQDGDEGGQAARLASAGGLALVGLGLTVSLDELAIGVTIGLLALPIWLAVALIAAQAFLLASLGLAVGARVRASVRAGAERLAGAVLLVLGLVLLAEKLG
jgi:putative Mn2+ efflux pump MntP